MKLPTSCSSRGDLQCASSGSRFNRRLRALFADRPIVDPCDVNVPGLTNREIVHELHRARTYLGGRNRGEDDYYAYDNLKRRLLEEIRRRSRQGHVWLAEHFSEVPPTLYQLSPGESGEILVMRVEGSSVSETPATSSPVLTPIQFQRFLERQQIPRRSGGVFLRQDPNAPAAPLRLFPLERQIWLSAIPGCPPVSVPAQRVLVLAAAGFTWLHLTSSRECRGPPAKSVVRSRR